MSGLIVSLEVTPFSHGSMAVFLKACVFAGSDKMGLLMFNITEPASINHLIAPKETTWNSPVAPTIILLDPYAQADRARTTVGSCKGRMRDIVCSYIVDLNGRGEVGFRLLRYRIFQSLRISLVTTITHELDRICRSNTSQHLFVRSKRVATGHMTLRRSG
jgi:hypothetical protein